MNMERAEPILEWLIARPDWLIYLIVGFAAAMENLVPPVPADVVILLGGVIAGAGGAHPWLLFSVVWLGNVGSALLVYAIGIRYGSAFLSGPLGRFLLAPAQVRSLAGAYQRFGFPIIFVSRFLPVFRPIVPVFAGISRLGVWRTAIPIALASGVWYGLLVYLGTVAGENLDAVFGYIARIGSWLWAIAGVLILLAGGWWWRTRRNSPGIDEETS
jgi:membrane protein DedA with SNARE-associated domain